MSSTLSKKKINSRAVILFSGGMDSTTLLYYCKNIHSSIHAVIIDYNQRHKKEIDHALRITKELNIPFTILNINLPRFAGSPLVDSTESVPSQSENKQASTIVPLRNTFFLLQACAIAITVGAKDVYIGAVGDDQRSYPDCRPNFFKAFQNMLTAQNEHLNIQYPFVTMNKEKIVALGQELLVPWHLTWTCYKGETKACGVCDACAERLVAFKNNKLKDPIEYE